MTERKIAPLPRDEFIAIWNASASIAEVAERTGIKRTSCRSRAGHLRRRGYDLKMFVQATRYTSETGREAYEKMLATGKCHRWNGAEQIMAGRKGNEVNAQRWEVMRLLGMTKTPLSQRKGNRNGARLKRLRGAHEQSA